MGSFKPLWPQRPSKLVDANHPDPPCGKPPFARSIFIGKNGSSRTHNPDCSSLIQAQAWKLPMNPLLDFLGLCFFKPTLIKHYSNWMSYFELIHHFPSKKHQDPQDYFFCCAPWIVLHWANLAINLHCLGWRWQSQKRLKIVTWLTHSQVNFRMQWSLKDHDSPPRKMTTVTLSLKILMSKTPTILGASLTYFHEIEKNHPQLSPDWGKKPPPPRNPC